MRRPSRRSEISFAPSRVLLQDLTGVPAVVDLAAMRNAMADLGGDPAKINPLIPAELVIDHSVQVDAFASRMAFGRNVELEFERNHERYLFLRWGQKAFSGFKVVPPGTGICHQVNLEYLARVVEDRDGVAFPDTLVGTDSHTTMVNGLGVLGWGVGGIEAEAAMLGQPLSMLVPQVVGFKLSGALPDGATATDLVLTVTEMLRKTGVVGKFVEYFGEGLHVAAARRPRDAREHVARVRRDVRLLPGRRRDARLPAADRTQPGAHRARRGVLQGEPALARPDASTRRTRRSSSSTSATSSRRSPARAGRRTACRSPRAKQSFLETLGSFGVDLRERLARQGGRRHVPGLRPDDRAAARRRAEPVPDDAPVATAAARRHHRVPVAGADYELDHGSVVIAAITSCTNTSNPQVMVAAGLLARNAVERGLQRKPWVKSSLAPGSKVVTRYYEQAGLQDVPRPARLQHRRLRLHDVHRQLGAARRRDLGGDQRGRPRRLLGALGQPQLRGAHPSGGEGELPRLAAARRRLRARRPHGHRLRDRADRHGHRRRGRLPARHLAERAGGRRDDRHRPCAPSSSPRRTTTSSPATTRGARCPCPEGELFAWEPDSTYVRQPPYFDGHVAASRAPCRDIAGARVPRVARRLGDDRPHLARRLDQAGLARPARTSSSTASSARTSTRTARGAATTR